MLLWQKSNITTDPQVHAFTVGEDYLLDQKLVKYDVLGSLAHARMLLKIDLLKNFEYEKIKQILFSIFQKAEKGEFKITQKEEDMHTAIENRLIKDAGSLGKKIHTGRSRNDQILTALKLFAKNESLKIELEALTLAQNFIDFAIKYEYIPLPGYTHTRLAMPSSMGQWAGAFAEGLLDDLKLLHSAFDYIDSCPLGSAAGYGVNIPLDREFTAELLGFKKVQINTLACANSRGKSEAVIISALAQISITLSKWASDLIWFSMPTFGFFIIPEEATTGSSIMPQKKNPDVLELIRAQSGLAIGALNQVQNIINSLISGYHRDFQLTKKPFLETIQNIYASLNIANKIMPKIKVDAEKCSTAFAPEIFAADAANELVLEKNLPFRDAYRKISENLNELKNIDQVKNLKSKKHLGAPGNLQLKKFGEIISTAQKITKNKQKDLLETWEDLWEV